MRRPLSLVLALCALLLPPQSSRAQVLRLDLSEMLERVDDVVAGEIVAQELLAHPDPSGEGTLWFTRITVDGRSLIDGREIVVDLHILGGMDAQGEGVWNSEAPMPEEVLPGGRVVVFYKWLDDMCAGLPGNFLYTMHGGLYRTVTGPAGPVVLGRGEGYPVRHNLRLDDLDQAVRTLTR